MHFHIFVGLRDTLIPQDRSRRQYRSVAVAARSHGAGFARDNDSGPARGLGAWQRCDGDSAHRRARACGVSHGHRQRDERDAPAADARYPSKIVHHDGKAELDAEVRRERRHVTGKRA